MLEGLLTRSSEVYAYVYFGSVIVVALAEAAVPRRRPGDLTGLRWLNNIAISILDTLVLRAAFPLATIGWAVLCDQRGWGLLNAISAPVAVTWVLTFVVLDFTYYIQHVMLHRIPILWRLHRTHHSDAEYDFTTGVRFHPIEGLFSTSMLLAAILVLGAPPAAVALSQMVFLISGFLDHANVRLPRGLERAMRTIFVTPDMHRIHHSIVMHEGQSNLSNLFSWWDRLFGTYVDQPASGHADLQFGLNEFRGRKHTTLPWMLVQPFMSGAPASPAVATATAAGARAQDATAAADAAAAVGTSIGGR